MFSVFSRFKEEDQEGIGKNHKNGFLTLKIMNMKMLGWNKAT